MKPSLIQARKFLLSFIHTQLFVLLISMPVLIHWGLPLSSMSLIGNLFFTPALMYLILLSTLIFFTELIGIPNELFISLFNIMSESWHWLLAFGSPSWLITQAHPGNIPLLLMPLINIIGLWHPKLKNINNTQNKRIMFMLSILTGSLCYLHLQPYFNHKQAVIILDSAISITQTIEKKIIITDNGYFNKKENHENMIRFTLKPYLVKHFGSTSIETLILNKISYRSFLAAQVLVSLCSVKKVILPYFDTLDKKTWREFFLLKKILATHNILLERFSLKQLKLNGENRKPHQSD